MNETAGTTEINQGIDEYRYRRFDFHIDRYLGSLSTDKVLTLQEVIKDYEDEIGESVCYG